MKTFGNLRSLGNLGQSGRCGKSSKIWENLEGAPNSERVVQDVNRTFDTHKIVYEAKDKMVPGLANRNGHRNKKEGNLKWGGKRTKSYVVAVDI